MKKLLAIILSCSLLLAILSGCSSKKEEPVNNQDQSSSQATKGTSKEKSNEKAEPVQKKPVRIFASITGGKDPDEHELWVKEFSKVSGIEIEMDKFEGKDYTEKVAAAIAGGDDYDIFYLNANDYEKLFKLGIFEPLTDRITNSEILSDPSIIDPSEWERIRRKDDNEIYYVFTKYEGGRLPLVRWDWMEKLNIKPPTTLDEYYEMLKAFTTKDPDGNGKDDTYGFTMKNGTYDIQPFMSAKGLVDGYAYDENGKRYIPWASDEAAEVYNWLNKLYDEGILDPNFVTNSSSNCRELIFSSKSGMMTYWDGWAGQFNSIAKAENPDSPFDIRGIAPALDENGNGYLTAGQDGLFVINVNSKNKDFAFKALEFLHTFDGNLLTTLGIEGHDYTKEGDKYTLTQVGQEHGMNHGSMTPKSLKWENPVGEEESTLLAREVVIKYAKPELLTEHSKNAKDIIDKYAAQAIMGEVTGEAAVEQMRKEMKEQGMID